MSNTLIPIVGPTFLQRPNSLCSPKNPRVKSPPVIAMLSDQWNFFETLVCQNCFIFSINKAFGIENVPLVKSVPGQTHEYFPQMWRFYSKISTDTENGTGLTVWQICISKKSSIICEGTCSLFTFFLYFQCWSRKHRRSY